MNRLAVDDAKHERLGLIAEFGVAGSERLVIQIKVRWWELILEDPLGHGDVDVSLVEVLNEVIIPENGGRDAHLDPGQIDLANAQALRRPDQGPKDAPSPIKFGSWLWVRPVSAPRTRRVGWTRRSEASS